MIELLEDLVKTPGVCGYEGPIREKIAGLVKGYGDLETDGMGNLFLSFGRGKTHLAFIAHMDELGLVVSNIEDSGMLRIKKLAYDDRAIAGRVFVIHTQKGPVTGVIGIKAPHLSDPEEMKKVAPGEKLCLDVGARSRAEAEKMGIRILDPVVLKKDFDIVNKKMVAARGLDNRIGCAVLVEALRQMKGKTPGCRVTFAWSVQEEIGLRGASVISRTLKPDFVFAVDTFSTTDGPDSSSHYSPVYLGKGPVLRMIDARAMASVPLKDRVVRIAAKAKIPVQFGVTGGSTDGAIMQEMGAHTLPLGVPLRYTHSPTELGHLDDINNLTRLIPKIIDDFGAKGK